MVQTKLKKLFYGTLVLLLWIAVWQIGAAVIGREIILPAPIAVFKRFFALMKTAPFWKACALSLVRIMSGYALGILLGVLLGVGMYFVKPIRVMFSPFLTVVKSTPVASFILVAYFIITDTAIPVFITFLMVLPMIASNVFASLESTDKDLLEMTRMYRLSFSKRIRTLYIPTAFPQFVAQSVMALGLGWKAGIAAEVLCTPRDSIGKYLYDAKTYLETVDTFAYTLLVIIISLCLEKLLKKLTQRARGGAK